MTTLSGQVLPWEEYTIMAKFGKTCTCDLQTGIETPFGNVHLTDFFIFINGTTFSGSQSIFIFLAGLSSLT